MSIISHHRGIFCQRFSVWRVQ